MQRFFPKLKLRDISLIALFVALYIVLSQFLSPMAGPVKIGLSFVAVMAAAQLYGVTGGVIAAGLGDFLGAVIFPIHGAYFFGFTLTAIVNGAIYGTVLSGEYKFSKNVLCVAMSQIICSLILNTAFNAMLMGAGFFAVLVKRLLQAAIMTPVQITLIHILSKTLIPKIKKALF